MELATKEDRKEILELYRIVIEEVNKTNVKLGWDLDVYPNKSFVDESIEKGQLYILRMNGKIVSTAVVNHKTNPEYDDIDWEIKEPKEKIATIHALAVAPDRRNREISYQMLKDIEDMCRANGDAAIHLDVIDTNIPAYKLYTRNGYKEVDCIKMFYDVVGTREFWMLERVL